MIAGDGVTAVTARDESADLSVEELKIDDVMKLAGRALGNSTGSDVAHGAIPSEEKFDQRRWLWGCLSPLDELLADHFRSLPIHETVSLSRVFVGVPYSSSEGEGDTLVFHGTPRARRYYDTLSTFSLPPSRREPSHL